MNAFRALRMAAATSLTVLAASAALAGPEIKVQMLLVGQAIDIEEGGEVTFPEIELGDTQAIFFSIENTGDEDLVLDDPAVEIVDQGGGFSVLAQPNAFPVPAGFSRTFRLTHTPPSDVLKQGRLFIFSNATNTAGPFDAVLLGKAKTVEEDPGDNIEPNEPADEVEPNEPVDEIEPNQPVDTVEPNEPVLDGDYQDPNDTNYMNDPDMTTDPHEYTEPDEYAGNTNDAGDNTGATETEQTADEEEVMVDDLAPVVPGCGFGIGFASMMCMVSLCGARRSGR